VENVATGPLQVESFGDGPVGIRLTADLVYADRTDRLFADLVYINRDRTTVSATFFSFASPSETSSGVPGFLDGPSHRRLLIRRRAG
jgi:hypothetical protein